MGRGRRQDNMDRLYAMLKLAPWWVGPLLAAAVFVVFRYLVPMFIPSPDKAHPEATLWRTLYEAIAWIGMGMVLVAWVAAEIAKLFNRRLFDRQRDIHSIRGLTWQEFECLITEAYRRQGYLSERVGSPSGDGGMDVVLRGHGKKIIVQCKQWRAQQVGVGPVRELLGVVTSELADRGILVTSGQFTSEAIRFAERNSCLELVDGKRLGTMIEEIKGTAPPQRPAVPPPTTAATPLCPLCRQPMVLRTARKGPSAGGQFWGCSRYPSCKGTRPA